MATKKYQLSIEDFTFPKKLDKRKANFRFVVELRYFGAKGQPQVITGTVPSLDSYWDCDWTKAYTRPPRYVGPDPGGSTTNPTEPSRYGTIDRTKLNPHEKLAVLVTSNGGLYSMNLTIYDVDRKDFWDVFLEKLAGVVEAMLGKAGDLLPDSVGIPDEVISAISKRLAGPGDRVIGTRGVLLAELPPERITISIGTGSYKGDYTATVGISEL